MERLDWTLTAAAPRLDRWLADTLVSAGLSRARLKGLILSGNLTLNGAPCRDPAQKLKSGDALSLTLPPPVAYTPAAQTMKLSIIYEDADILVIDKPAGLVVHPAPGNRDQTLVNGLLAHAGASLSGIGGVKRPGIVHRLDKDTSGLLVVAKHDAAHQALAKQFADRSLSRTYLAVVHGRLARAAGTIDAPIGRHNKDRKRLAVTTRGKKAITHYERIALYAAATLVQCKLETGRTHQIRVHLAHLGHPLLGDPVYGARRRLPETLPPFDRQALHAKTLRLQHPKNGKTMTFNAELPQDFKRLIKALEKPQPAPNILKSRAHPNPKRRKN